MDPGSIHHVARRHDASTPTDVALPDEISPADLGLAASVPSSGDPGLTTPAVHGSLQPRFPDEVFFQSGSTGQTETLYLPFLALEPMDDDYFQDGASLDLASPGLFALYPDLNVSNETLRPTENGNPSASSISTATHPSSNMAMVNPRGSAAAEGIGLVFGSSAIMGWPAREITETSGLAPRNDQDDSTSSVTLDGDVVRPFIDEPRLHPTMDGTHVPELPAVVESNQDGVFGSSALIGWPAREITETSGLAPRNDQDDSTSSATLDGDVVRPSIDEPRLHPTMDGTHVPEPPAVVESNQDGPEQQNSSSGPSARMWLENRDKIERLYVDQDLTLSKVRDIMRREDGFNASAQMFKKRFKKWGLRKYKKSHESDTSLTLVSPVYLPEASTRLGQLMEYIDQLYTLGIRGRKWKLDSPFKVQENEYEDLFFTVVCTMNEAGRPGCKIRKNDMNDIMAEVSPVVNECGLFALPAIWVSVARMLLKQQIAPAKSFLRRTGSLVQQSKAYGREQIIAIIAHMIILMKMGAQTLLHALTTAYDRCIRKVIGEARMVHLTFLSLQSFYIVYLNKSSQRHFDQALGEFRELLRHSESINGKLDDITLDIVGQQLFLLQSTPTTAPELARTAHDMLSRINRRMHGGEKLEGGLLTKWKDCKQTLACMYHAKGDKFQAVSCLDEYFGCCGMDRDEWDDCDTIAWGRLEDWRKEIEA